MIRARDIAKGAMLIGLIALAAGACSSPPDATKGHPGESTAAASSTTTQAAKGVDPVSTTIAAGPLVPDPTAGEDQALYNLAYRPLNALEWFGTIGYVNGQASITPGPLAAVGDQESFRLSDGSTIIATLLYANDGAAFWVEDDLALSEDAIGQAADRFADETVPRVSAVFGPVPDPGIDGDRRVAVLHVADLGGAAGEFVSQDLLPASEFAQSNEREMIYVGMDGLAIGSDVYFATLAHELQHLIDYAARQNTPLWMAEGMAQVAERVAGFDQVITDDDYLSSAAVPLNDWNIAQLDDRHYGGSYLFLTYLYERYGPQAMTDLMGSTLTGMAAVDALARARGSNLDRLMGDWLVAIALDDPSVGDGRFVFEADDLGRACPVIQPDQTPFKEFASFPQFAPRYYRINGTGPIEVNFEGNDVIGVIPDLPYRGEYLWWAGRADNSLSSMTRSFDLSNVVEATLQYRVWFDTGLDDGGTIMVSTDGGVSWDLLAGRRSEQITLGTEYPIPAYTGSSGSGADPIWIRDEVDLSDYVGESDVLIRFAFATDLFEGRIGLAIDNVEIVEIAYFDGGENGSDWQLDGFTLTNNRLPQPWAIRVIQPGAANPVTEILLEQGAGSITIDGDAGPATVAVVATAPGVGTEAEYQLEINGDLDLVEDVEGDQENFSMPCPGWEIEETDSYSLAIDDDALVITIRQDDIFAWSSQADFHEDATISASLSFETDQEALAGLMCRLNNQGFYDFEISSDGFFFAGVQTSEGFETLQTWTSSPAIRTGQGAINRIELACLGDNFRFSVNGRTVLTLTNDEVRAGRLALSAGSFLDLTGDVVVAFADVVIDGAELATLDKVVLHETFGSQNTDWTGFNTARSAVSIEDDAYRFEVRGSDWSSGGYYEQSFDDTIIDANVRINQLPPESILGLSCRTDQDLQQYLFLVSADGFFALLASLQDDFVEIVPWSPLYALDTQVGAINQFHMECVGDRLLFEVNGVVAADVTDGRLTGGRFGFIGITYERGGLSFDVLDLVLRQP